MQKKRVFDYSVICVVMGGGAGSRLYPLTHERAKPAVPIAAKYRIIDVPISNCLNSGLNRIYILTQFNSTSLHRHISRSYHFDRFSRGFVEILAAQQTPQYTLDHSWYEGTADAVRKNLIRIRESGGDHVLILSGDQLYQMNYRHILRTHRGDKDGVEPADVTIAGLLVDRERARSLGIMKIDATGRVESFLEKPGQNDKLFEGFEAPSILVRQFDLDPAAGPYYLANMGIYVFGLPCLEKLLDNKLQDFGGEVLPQALESVNVRAHLFLGYWEDIGTIATFHRANLDLARDRPQFDFYSEARPIYTRARLLPACLVREATIRQSLISEGCQIGSATIENSLIGIRSRIGHGCTIRNTFVMGADHFETDVDRHAARDKGLPDLGIGDGTIIENAIIDKGARVGRDVRIRNTDGVVTHDGEYVYIRDGIVIVPRRGVVPDGFSL